MVTGILRRDSPNTVLQQLRFFDRTHASRVDAWLRLCCSVGQPILAAAGFQPALAGHGEWEN
jgi:hypothetical protein